MAEKNSEKKAKADDKEAPDSPPLPGSLDEAMQDKDIQKKMSQLKSKLESFQKDVLSKFKEYVLGIALLPPPMPAPGQPGIPPGAADKQEAPQGVKEVAILVLIDDSDVKKMTKWELKDKLDKIIDKTAKDIEKSFKPEIMILSELREACFDARYEVLRLLSMAALLYDPKDLLAALKVSEIHKSMVMNKFEKYVMSYVAVGSLFRGDARSHDIDVAVIVDDTDVKKMSRFELRDKLGAIIRTMGYDAAAIAQVKKSFHIQVYILTDFWEGIREASPVFFTFLRDGVPLFDRGVFMPWKLLLQMGRIKPSSEAIDMHMDVGLRLIDRAKGKMLGIVAEDIYYAALNPSQAALMLYGIPPTTPKETIAMVDEIFVKKEKMLEEKYARILERTVHIFKDIEHGKIKEMKGAEVDKMLADVEDYLERIKKLVSQIEKRTDRQHAREFFESVERVVTDVFGQENISEKDIVKGFKRLVDAKKFTNNDVNTLKDVIKLKDDFGKLSKQEIEKIRREGAGFLRGMMDYLQRKRGAELERAHIRVKYGEKFSDIYMLDTLAYLIEDGANGEKIVNKAPITPEGGIGSFAKSSVAELDDALAKVKIPKSVFIKEKIFEDLRKLYGKDVEVQVGR